MLRKLSAFLFGFVFLLGLALLWPGIQGRLPAQQAQKQYKDRGEYDMFNAVIKETDPAKKIQLLDQWKAKYPDTAFQEERLKSYMITYQQAGQPAKAIEAAQQVLAAAPGDFSADFTIASLAPFITPPDPKITDAAQSAATELLQSADTQFAADKKPAGVSDADWANGKKQAQTVAHQALGWVAMTKKSNEAAEKEFVQTLQLTPTAAQVSFWLGTVVLAQKNPDKNTLAIFSFARAASYDGPGALPPAGRKQMDDYLTKVYNNYHGADAKSLADLKTLAKTQPLPPADFKILSSDEIAAAKEEELKKDNPLMAVFMGIKENLTGSDGASFWESQLKAHAMPTLRGIVVSATPAVRPKTIELAMSQGNTSTPEVVLTLDEPLRGKVEPGTAIEFKDSEPTEYTASPFMIKMKGGTITKGVVEAPPPAKKAPARPKAAAKKAAE